MFNLVFRVSFVVSTCRELLLLNWTFWKSATTIRLPKPTITYSCIFCSCSWLGLKMYRIYTRNFHSYKNPSTECKLWKTLQCLTQSFNHQNKALRPK
jgi:hypothetical protein